MIDYVVILADGTIEPNYAVTYDEAVYVAKKHRENKEWADVKQLSELIVDIDWEKV